VVGISFGGRGSLFHVAEYEFHVACGRAKVEVEVKGEVKVEVKVEVKEGRCMKLLVSTLIAEKG